MNLKQPLILASKSPRRQQLLRDAGFVFEVKTLETPEIYQENMPAVQVPEYLAKIKAEAFAAIAKDKILLTADTVVVINDKVLEKPALKPDAIEMLSLLSGKKHLVVTGICILENGTYHLFSDITTVYFNTLTKEEITYYIDEFQPFDKAGAYGIQEWIGLTGIRKIEGSFYNVMGLPIDLVYRELKKHVVS